ncbi:diguanylate cyclase [Bacillus ectoiniformans]|uniref:GGDEF domain-containing protein n=1 Tax=Bacillus ectoiniformans TaxID=1494429 RepID=UPI00195D70BE|nr:GGDEF domain-containing protein [Bacillus ectoiniformans]MBM7648294.1 diguanylate cyclase [Bacillus ectoiniformans]
MIQTLFLNIAVLAFGVFLAGIILQKMSVPSLKSTLVIGVLAGLLGWELMLLSLKLDSHTVSDMRHIVTVAAAVYIGPLAGLISAIVIAAGRIILFEISPQALLAAANMVLIGIICMAASRLKWSKRAVFMLFILIGEGIVWISLYINLENHAGYFTLLGFRLFVSVIGGYFIYRLIEYVIKTNSLFMQNMTDANTDHLTALGNRRSFDKELKLLFQQSTDKKPVPFSLVLFDIDHFKKFNDQHGHVAGDELLRSLGKIVDDVVGDAGSAYRYGGEEFCLIIKQKAHKEAVLIAEKLRNRIARSSFTVNQLKVRVTVSIGVASFPEKVSQPERVLTEADQLLYAVKESGRNQVGY